MQLQTILNRVEKHKSFVYGNIRFVDQPEMLELEVTVVPRANSRPICSGCRRKRPGYDHLPPRRFEFVPVWQIAVFFVYALRRVDCAKCGVTAEEVPGAKGSRRTPERTSGSWQSGPGG